MKEMTYGYEDDPDDIRGQLETHLHHVVLQHASVPEQPSQPHGIVPLLDTQHKRRKLPNVFASFSSASAWRTCATEKVLTAFVMTN